jgi:hypothetical protein
MGWLAWIAVGVSLSPIWATLLFELWQCLIRPRLVPRREIERRASEMLARHGDRAADVCFINAHRAWYDCDGFEQAMWRRVGEAIENRI